MNDFSPFMTVAMDSLKAANDRMLFIRVGDKVTPETALSIRQRFDEAVDSINQMDAWLSARIDD